MSKLLYIQQLGRGTRKSEGKECLFVFDFVDNAGRFAQAVHLHRLFKKDRYGEGGLVCAPKSLMAEEENEFENGTIPSILLNINLWPKDYEIIDIFSWKDETKDMLSLSELGIALHLGAGTTRNWLKAKKIEPDLTVPLGIKEYYFFHRSRVEEFRKRFGLKKHTKETIKEDFFDFVREMDMSASYKPVLVLAMIDLSNNDGMVPIKSLVQSFRSFYAERMTMGLQVERESNKLSRVSELDNHDIEATILASPFEKFERRQFMEYDRDLAFVRFSHTLWSQLGGEDFVQLRELARQAIEKYYSRIK